MKIADLTYAELAQRYEVELCTGWCHERGHDEGFVARRMVHFAERGVTRSGLRKFLMLIHDLRVWPDKTATIDGRPRAVRAADWYHSRNVFAYRTAFHDLGIRLDRKLSAGDRARVRHLLLGLNRPELKTLRNWARAG